MEEVGVDKYFTKIVLLEIRSGMGARGRDCWKTVVGSLPTGCGRDVAGGCSGKCVKKVMFRGNV